MIWITIDKVDYNKENISLYIRETSLCDKKTKEEKWLTHQYELILISEGVKHVIASGIDYGKINSLRAKIKSCETNISIKSFHDKLPEDLITKAMLLEYKEKRMFWKFVLVSTAITYILIGIIYLLKLNIS